MIVIHENRYVIYVVPISSFRRSNHRTDLDSRSAILSVDSWVPPTNGKLATQLSNEKNPGCLGYIGDYTTQLYRDYNKPSIIINHYKDPH